MHIVASMLQVKSVLRNNSVLIDLRFKQINFSRPIPGVLWRGWRKYKIDGVVRKTKMIRIFT